MLIAREKLVVYAAIDLSAFIWFAKSLGCELTWRSRKQTTQDAQEYSKYEQLVWEGRQLQRGVLTIGPGLWSRMLTELVTPYSVITNLLEEEDVVRKELEDEES
jgi:hypothetical protein